MNEKDLEERLRGVVDGPQPSAPPSLHAFLRSLPEAHSTPRRMPLVWLRSAAGTLRGSVSVAPAARRAQLAFAVSLALVIGLAGGALLMSARQHPVPAALPSIAASTPTSTPRRSLDHSPSYYPFILGHIGGFNWSGILSSEDGNDTEALPVSAVEMVGGGYIGISSDMYGQNGLVFSQDGIFWNWDPPTEVDPSGVTLTSIASDDRGRLVVVGAAQGQGATKDGRIYTSTDGHTWTPVPAATALFGGTAIRTVAYGPAGYVALGWNDNDPASRTVREWVSTDGIHWNAMSGVPIVGPWGFVIWTTSGYLLSGTAQQASADQPPIWTSSDGHSWRRASSSDGKGSLVGPIISATVEANGRVIAVARSTDGSGNELIFADKGMQDTLNTWALLPSSTDIAAFMEVASIRGSKVTSDTGFETYSHLLVATSAASAGHVYVSIDDGTTWSIASGLSSFDGAPLGQALLQLGVNYGGDSAKVLCYGKPSYGMGIWLASAVSP